MIVEQIRGGGGGLKSFDKVLGRQSTRPTADRMLATDRGERSCGEHCGQTEARTQRRRSQGFVAGGVPM
jgi:hypothetical protein